jgi:lysophospholipase L1-like esterase
MILTDPHVLTPEDADRLLDGAPWRRFAILGDSVAEGLGEEVEGYGRENWGARVSAALRRQTPNLAFCNFGERYLRAREVIETQLEPALSFRPDLAAVVCGGNDMLDPGFDPAVLEEELDLLVGSLGDAGAEVITFTLFDITQAMELPAAFGDHIHSRLGQHGDVVRRVASRRGTIHVEFTSHPASADAGIYSSDRMHVNTRGHAIVASATIERLGGWLGNRTSDR